MTIVKWLSVRTPQFLGGGRDVSNYLFGKGYLRNLKLCLHNRVGTTEKTSVVQYQIIGV